MRWQYDILTSEGQQKISSMTPERRDVREEVHRLTDREPVDAFNLTAQLRDVTVARARNMTKAMRVCRHWVTSWGSQAWRLRTIDPENPDGERRMIYVIETPLERGKAVTDLQTGLDPRPGFIARMARSPRPQQPEPSTLPSTGKNPPSESST